MVPPFLKTINGGKGIPTSIWSSDPSDENPVIKLRFKKNEKFNVSAVVVETMNSGKSSDMQSINNPYMKKNLAGAQVDICEDL